MPQTRQSDARAARGSFVLSFGLSVLIPLAVLATWAVLVTTQASAQVLCRCALRSLETLLCENTLTAQVRVRWGLSLPDGSRLYAARVLQTFHGESAREIWIETPTACGFELRPLHTYALSVNRTENGTYTTFACASFVREWRELTRDEQAVLEAPACAKTCDDVACAVGERCVLQPVECIRAPCPELPVCEPVAASEDEICYRFSESDAAAAIDRPCAAGLECISTSELIGFDALKQCKPQGWCRDDTTAASDCDGLPHVLVLGNWSCSDHQCSWLAGVPAP